MKTDGERTVTIVESIVPPTALKMIFNFSCIHPNTTLEFAE